MSSKIFIPAFLLLILSEMVPASPSGIILNGFDELRERVATETKIENERRANSEAALRRVNSDLGMEKTEKGAHRRRASTSAIYDDFDQLTKPNPPKNYVTFDEIRSGSVPLPHFAPTNPAPRLTSADRRKIIKASKLTTLARKESKFGRKLSAIISPLKLKGISWRSLSNLLAPNRNRTNGRKRLLS